MAHTPSVTVKVDESAIKERMREYLAQAWDEGAQARWDTPDSYSVKDMNPYRDPPLVTL